MKFEPKGCMDFIAEDETLSIKMTTEEYENNKFAPANSDESLSKAYMTYKKVMESLNA